ncbi:AAA family ATPase [Herbidospora mongoliensis]|uniref:AAA family ATPase n=1 Tax=Herbidospora mongoliensis TaxID=688067 RepID=UPI000836A10F|nr:ATP-binding protein [Herbidospora mongoliensis]
MLLSFRLANVLSLRDEQQLSLIATDLNGGSARPLAIRDSGKSLAALPVVAIYGANASGKTNVLSGLELMRQAVLESVSWFNETELDRRVAFALDDSIAATPSYFEVDLEIGGIRYTYGFEIDDDRVRGEWLHAYPRGRRQVWFDRAEDEFQFPGSLKGDRQDLVRKTRPDALFLAVAAEWNSEQLMPVFDWFRVDLRVLSPARQSRNLKRRSLVHPGRLVRDRSYRDRVTRLLTIADQGITGFDSHALEEGEIRFLHAGKPLRFDQESLGTRTWFVLLGHLIRALDHGAVLVVDELDASLHPVMVAEIIRMFEDPEANRAGAQLIFTTHDATLLRPLPGGDRILDRDAVWMTEKDASGATKLYPVSGLEPPPRKDENLERGYLTGRYGGTPRVTPGELARGLTEAAVES